MTDILDSFISQKHTNLTDSRQAHVPKRPAAPASVATGGLSTNAIGTNPFASLAKANIVADVSKPSIPKKAAPSSVDSLTDALSGMAADTKLSNSPMSPLSTISGKQSGAAG